MCLTYCNLNLLVLKTRILDTTLGNKRPWTHQKAVPLGAIIPTWVKFKSQFRLRRMLHVDLNHWLLSLKRTFHVAFFYRSIVEQLLVSKIEVEMWKESHRAAFSVWPFFFEVFILTPVSFSRHMHMAKAGNFKKITLGLPNCWERKAAKYNKPAKLKPKHLESCSNLTW